jgi:hypothetical protein
MKLKVRFGIFTSIICVSGIYAQQADLPVLKGPYLGQTPPGKTPVRFQPEGFKRGQHAEPVFLFFSEGKECLFTGDGGLFYTEMKNGSWTRPVNTNTYGGYMDFEPNISPDGESIFFNSIDRPLPEGTEKPRVAIWMFERKNDGWSKPEYAGFSGMYVTVSKERNIYFTLRKDGVDCLAMRRIVDGEYKETEIIPPPVYSEEYHDKHPSIAPDGSYLVFDSENRPRKNRCGLYVSFRKHDGAWTEPVSLGDFIAQDNAAIARITSDGKYLFFNDRNGDNWWVSSEIVEVLKERRTEK